MGNTECSVEKDTNCLKEQDRSFEAHWGSHGQKGNNRYLAAQEDNVAYGRSLVAHGDIPNGKSTVAASEPVTSRGAGSSSAPLPLEGFSDQDSLGSPMTSPAVCMCGAAFAFDTDVCHGCGRHRRALRIETDSRDVDLLLPLPGEDEDCDLKIWRALPDPQTGSIAANQRAAARAVQAELKTFPNDVERTVHALGPGRSAAKPPMQAKDDPAKEPDEDDLPPVERKVCYFDIDLGEHVPVPSHIEEGMFFKHVFRSGAAYEGEWHQGMRHGVGKQRWPDNTEYIGEWKRGRAMGNGRIKHADGDTYCGQWVNGRAQGRGVYRAQTGQAVYEGEFKCDLRDGKGIELWIDGSYYSGEFVKGAKHGLGEHVWPDSTHYLGTWRGNELCGPGRYTMKDGIVYEGHWSKSAIHGIGSYQWPNGQTYNGYYKMDKKHGLGVMVSPEGDRKECYWENGKPLKAKPTRK